MRKSFAIGSAALLLTAGLSSSAWAAAPEAPTDVQVAWAGDKIRVTWKDNGEANVVRAEYLNEGQKNTKATTAAGADNEVLIARNLILNRDRIQLTVDAKGTDQSVSPAAASPLFDALPPVYPIIEDADLLSDGSVRLARWTQPAIQDATPDDPLDRPASDGYLGAQVVAPGSSAKERMLIPAGATSFTVPPRPRPATITLYAGNEWRESSLHLDGHGRERKVEVGTMAAAFVVPPMGTYSVQLGIWTTLKSNLVNISPLVQLQARPNSASPWRTYGRYYGDLHDPVPTGMASLGGRQYRILALPFKEISQDAIKLTAAASTSARSSKTIAKIYTRGIVASKARAGRTVGLKVQVQPAIDMKAALQKWDGKQWRYWRELALKAGVASIQFRATAPAGTTRYRVLTPAVKVNGLPVLATSTSYFTLTVY